MRTAIRAIGRDFVEPEKEVRVKEVVDAPKGVPSEKLRALLSEKPKIINVGLKSFAEVVEQLDAKSYSTTGCRRQEEMWS